MRSRPSCPRRALGRPSCPALHPAGLQPRAERQERALLQGGPRQEEAAWLLAGERQGGREWIGDAAGCAGSHGQRAHPPRPQTGALRADYPAGRSGRAPDRSAGSGTSSTAVSKCRRRCRPPGCTPVPVAHLQGIRKQLAAHPIVVALIFFIMVFSGGCCCRGRGRTGAAQSPPPRCGCARSCAGVAARPLPGAPPACLLDKAGA